ncbi:putative chemotaxis MotB protein [Plesiocystis pacifica SIR-1]|uniref:Putative chemotaxis MotB protein n=1 Tax=Plesiocystis pacifica SIR-1 TaxID=391625 RepID=A6G5D3_9BACT|nr:OmpA family protein [Plesiocystis pacifica]EDM78876.1 putative chemotaxis MotB protein [Plesiocystis pacifica SIR-1]
MMRRVAILLPLFALLAGGCKKVDELQAALDASQAELKKTQKELEAERQANVELEAENQTLQERIAELEAEIEQLERQIKDLAEKAGLTEKELAELRAEKAKREAELQVYRDLFASLKKMVDAGTIKVGFREGRLVVKLDEGILFDSGRAKLKKEGQAALTELIAPLRDVNRDWIVAGHTDNVPIKTAKFQSNWELSSARAVEVVTFLIDTGMPAERIGSAGYAEFDPVADNSSPEGRAQNRRIEIVLMPTIPKNLQDMLSNG